MSAFDGIGKDFKGLLDAFEKGIIFGRASSCALVRMMAKDLLPVGALDLGVGGAITVFGKTEDSIMVLSLRFV